MKFINFRLILFYFSIELNVLNRIQLHFEYCERAHSIVFVNIIISSIICFVRTIQRVNAWAETRSSLYRSQTPVKG